jgi:peptidoglycan/xylan/chitin deacetylase (PgdA/CDA1 family)
MRWKYHLADVLGEVKDGFGLQITGDIDAPDMMDSGVLKEWVSLASKASFNTPILYVTVSPLQAFERIVEVAKGVEIGVHGLTHVDYTLMPDNEMRSDFRKISTYSRKIRFPFLARDLRTLRLASEYFESDSSFTARWKPFVPFLSVPNFYEYPVIPPSDTYFRGKPIGPEQAADVVAQSVRYCRKNGIFCTLLLHPTEFVNEMLRNLRVDE